MYYCGFVVCGIRETREICVRSGTDMIYEIIEMLSMTRKLPRIKQRHTILTVYMEAA